MPAPLAYYSPKQAPGWLGRRGGGGGGALPVWLPWSPPLRGWCLTCCSCWAFRTAGMPSCCQAAASGQPATLQRRPARGRAGGCAAWAWLSRGGQARRQRSAGAPCSQQPSSASEPAWGPRQPHAVPQVGLPWLELGEAMCLLRAKHRICCCCAAVSCLLMGTMSNVACMRASMSLQLACTMKPCVCTGGLLRAPVLQQRGLAAWPTALLSSATPCRTATARQARPGSHCTAAPLPPQVALSSAGLNADAERLAARLVQLVLTSAPGLAMQSHSSECRQTSLTGCEGSANSQQACQGELCAAPEGLHRVPGG